MYFTYAIRNDGRDIYIGHTEDIEKRLKRHNQELPSKRSSFTYKRKKGTWKLIYKEKLKPRGEAIKREKQLKSYQGRQFLKKIIVQLVDPPAGGLLS